MFKSHCSLNKIYIGASSLDSQSFNLAIKKHNSGKLVSFEDLSFPKKSIFKIKTL